MLANTCILHCEYATYNTSFRTYTHTHTHTHTHKREREREREREMGEREKDYNNFFLFFFCNLPLGCSYWLFCLGFLYCIISILESPHVFVIVRLAAFIIDVLRGGVLNKVQYNDCSVCVCVCVCVLTCVCHLSSSLSWLVARHASSLMISRISYVIHSEYKSWMFFYSPKKLFNVLVAQPCFKKKRGPVGLDSLTPSTLARII